MLLTCCWHVASFLLRRQADETEDSVRKRVSHFKKSRPEPLDPEVSAALRDLAGWPVQQHHEGGSIRRHRTVSIQRDGAGNVTSSIEQIDEDEYQEYSDNWGK
jgi:hypothetical protein